MTHRTLRVAALSTMSLLAACSSSPSESESVGATDSALVTATGVDYSWARPSPGGLKSEGYTFAARYFSHDTSGKNVTKSEAAALWAAGVDVVANWEGTSTGALNGYAQGVADAQAAVAEANAAGIPAGRPIYFSVDFDATPANQTPINAYFDGVISVIGVARAGAYAGYYVIKRLFDAGKITWGWQTYAWSGGQWDARAQLRQVQNGISAAGDANCCDKDQAVATDFGQWHAAPAIPADQAPRGAFDAAACTGIGGWSQDPDAPKTPINVDFYFNGAAGAAGAEGLRVTASADRQDLCTAIGSCNHGFAFPMPLGVQDGKPHPVHAYGIDTAGGANPELTNSPKTFTCPNATPPLVGSAGVKRHVVDATAMKAWGFSSLVDVAPEPDSVVGGFADGGDWAEKPALVQADDKTPEVWLVDGTTRRHVVSGDSLAAWHRTFAEVVKTPAATVYALKQGPDLPATPFLMIGTGPAVYVLDVSPATPPGPTGTDSDGGVTLPLPSGTDDGGAAPNANPDDGTTTTGHGCSVQGVSSGPSNVAWPVGLGLGLAVLTRRRRSSSRRR